MAGIFACIYRLSKLSVSLTHVFTHLIISGVAQYVYPAVFTGRRGGYSVCFPDLERSVTYGRNERGGRGLYAPPGVSGHGAERGGDHQLMCASVSGGGGKFYRRG